MDKLIVESLLGIISDVKDIIPFLQNDVPQKFLKHLAINLDQFELLLKFKQQGGHDVDEFYPEGEGDE